MTPNLKTLKVLILILLFLPFMGNTQCYEDFFGFWKTYDGKFIKLIEYDPIKKIKEVADVGDRNHYFKGIHFYEDGLLKIVHYEDIYDEKEKKIQTVRRGFYFKVLAVGQQTMEIRPISDEMKKIFGETDVTLFNEYFISFDEFEFDSLYYEKLHLPYEIQIDGYGNMKKEEDVSYNGKKKKYYSGKLNEKQFQELIDLIIKSKITSMSKCKLTNFCADCYTLTLKIFNNGKTSFYSVGRIHDSAVPLVIELNKIVLEIKWNRIKKKKIAENKS